MNLSFLASTSLFQNIRPEEIQAMMACLQAREKTYRKNETIFHTGDTVREIGLVEKGSVNIVARFFWGDSNIFGRVEKGGIFAETYAAIPGKELLCDIVAAEDCTVLFLNMNHLLTTCSTGCAWHTQIIYNLVRIAANANLNLSSRMMHIAPKSIRDRLLSYLSEQAVANGGLRFTIPFSRQQLADYLSVDRSALSNELSKMQRDGLLTYHKSDFALREDAVLS